MLSVVRRAAKAGKYYAAGVVAAQRTAVHSTWQQSSSSSSVATATEDASTLRPKYGNVLGGERCNPAAFNAFKAWHEALDMKMTDNSSDDDIYKVMAPHVAAKVKFHPPTYFAVWEGRDKFLLLISCVGEVFGPSFEYGRQWLSPDGKSWALEFTAKIGDSGKGITGIDLVELDDEGRIVDFVVLARPPNGVEELKKAMMMKVPPRMAMMKAKSFFK